MQELAGKVAVVTGAASGIGLALARRFAQEGMRVVLADVERDTLDEAAIALGKEHGDDNVLAVPTDVRDPDAVDSLAAATFDRFDTAHVVCNNAGVAGGGLMWTVDPATWRWIVDVNLLGVTNGIRSFVPRFVEQGEGHVVNTASIAGLITGPGMGPYFATKHGVVALSESLHFDLQLAGASGVGVSVVCPLWVRTGIAESERNAPTEVPQPDYEHDAGAQFLRTAVLDLVAGGIDPAIVAGKVVDAIHAGDVMWVLTHEGSMDLVEQRHRAIEQGGSPAMWVPI